MANDDTLTTVFPDLRIENKDELLIDLYQAVATDEHAKVDSILKAGVHPDWTETLIDHGDLALTAAAGNGNAAILELLLTHDATVNLANASGMTALHKAVQVSNMKCVKLLLDAGALCTLQDISGNTPLHIAANKGHVNILRDMLRTFQGSLNIPNNSQWTALHCAVNKGDLESVRLLLDAGSSCNCVDGDGRTVLHLSVLHDKIALVQMLLEYNSLLDVMDSVYHTPLFDACWYGYDRISYLLLNAGAHYDIVDHNGYTPLAFASLNGHGSVLQQLLNAGAQINKAGYLNQTALHHAVWATQLHCLQLLLDHGANPNAISTEGHTPLFCSLLRVATTVEDVITWKALIRANTNLEIEGSVSYYSECMSCTHLQLAILIGHTAAVRVLIQGGADLKPVKKWIKAGMLPKRLPKQSEFTAWLTMKCSNPPTLLSIVRQRIRANIGINPTHKINSLPLPGLLRDYLNLRDLDEIELN